jgi:DNA (cytosine-5)-methyltransferase 1
MTVSNAVTPDAYLASGKRKRVDGKAVLTSMHERRIRRLTPTECERLQGFPDGWTEGVSDTQRYKQLGNAVTVNVIESIVRCII